MSPPDRGAAGWNRFWFAGVDGTALALVRVGFAVAALSMWMATVPDLGRYYGSPDVPAATARAWGTEWIGRFLVPDAVGGSTAAVVLAALHVGALVALLVGWSSRLASLAAWLLGCWFQLRNPSILNAGDAVLRLTSFYLALAFLAVGPAERALSVDRASALKRGATEGDVRGPTRIPAWTLRLLQIQACLIYFVSGFWKLTDPAWRDGTALWIALANPVFSRLGPAFWAPHALFAGATAAVAAWELLFPLLVALRPTRRPALAFGIAMHGFILVFLNTGIFPLAMLALYPAFLVPELDARASKAKLATALPL